MRTAWMRAAALVTASFVALGGCGSQGAAPGVPDEVEGGADVPDAGPEPIDCKNSVGLQDGDGDGFSRTQGDCDDCEKGIGPGALEVVGNGIDEDCSGEDLLEPPAACDEKLKPKSAEAESAAQALGLCDQHSQASHLPGLIEASWARLSGDKGLIDTRQVWFPEKFGSIAAREGTRLVVLSTGVARDASDAEYTPDCDTFNSTPTGMGTVWSDPEVPPAGYPRDSSKCPKGTRSGDALAFNEVILKLTLRAPTNVKSLSFDSMFFTYEYPDFVCSDFNDFFIVQVDPAPKSLDDDNVLFDVNDDPIGVNTGLLTACREAERGRVARPIACESGPGLLAKTGFDAGESRCAAKQTDKRDIGGASTGWLHTNVPVPAGKLITLRFVLWDSADPLLDSTVLLDNFRWSLDERQVSTGPISGG